MTANKAFAIIYLEDGWQNEIKAKAIDKLEAMLEDLSAKSSSSSSSRLFTNREYAEIYTVCYNMCTQRSPYNWSEQLYQRHGDTIAYYLEHTVLPKLKGQHGEFLLQELARRGANHNIMNKWLKNFFMYLDRYYVKYHSLPSLEDSGRRKFKAIIFDVLKRDVANAILELVDKERDGGVVDRELIASTVQMYEAMGHPPGSIDVYINDFETHFLAGSRAYYARKTESWLRNDGAPAYMAKVENALREEMLRVQNYLHPETGPKIQRVIEDETIAKHLCDLLEKEGSGFRSLLANDMGQDLSRMYRLFLRVTGGTKPMGEILKTHIILTCADKIALRMVRLEEKNGGANNNSSAGTSGDRDSDPQFVKELIDIHLKMVHAVRTYLDGDSLFLAAIKDAFGDVLNRNAGKVKVAYLLSSFCDGLLKTGSPEKLSDVDTENYLEQSVRLFTYLDDKDMFAQLYRSQLSKRLLNQRSASDDMERAMIGKLKLQCGSQYTAKMEGMLNDLSIGIEHATSFDAVFKDRMAQNAGLSKMDFTVQVLTNGHWPVISHFDVKLPPQIQACARIFEEFYSLTTTKRKLNWHYGLGNATVKGVFGTRTYDLLTSTLQAIVLLLFNMTEKPLLYSQIACALGIPEEHLKRTLRSLCGGKLKILKRIQIEMPASYVEPVGAGHDKNQIKGSDTFAVNDAFTSQMRKIRLPMPSLEDNMNPKQVDDDRVFATDASIMRIMKARKTLGHQELIGEVIGQLSFFRADPKVRFMCLAVRSDFVLTTLPHLYPSLPHRLSSVELRL